MIGTTRKFSLAGACALGLGLMGLFAASAQAASINYGSFGPIAPGVTFIDVEESSGTDAVPLFGPPTPFAIGLDHNPTNFTASSTNGGADLTDGQYNFTVDSVVPITNLSVSERGDYTLVGAGGALTNVSAGAVLFATVTEINGLAVAPINLAPVNASVAFNVAANAGIVQPWSLGLGLNVGVAGATRIDVVINNALTASSQPGGIAFIAKKDFIVEVGAVPEPTSLGLASCVLGALGLVARRKRG
jgi:hypothetical protein